MAATSRHLMVFNADAAASGGIVGRVSGCTGFLAPTEVFDEPAEEVVRDFRGRAIDQPRSDLCQLAAHLRLGLVVDARTAALRKQPDLRFAAGESCGAALPFEFDRIRLRRDDIVQHDATTELCRDRPDPCCHRNLVFVLGHLIDRFAPGDACLQHLGIVERVPGGVHARGYVPAAVHFHDGASRLYRCDAYAARGSDGVRPRANERWANTPASCLRLSRLCTGRNSSTYGSMARMPAGRASKPS